jgi:UDP-N-acetylmuramate dehydrogenase
MTVVDGKALLERLSGSLAGIRGRMTSDAPMEQITWFRTGGPAEVLFPRCLFDPRF